MKINITIEEAEVITDALNLLQDEIERYEPDELIPSMVREGERVAESCMNIKGRISEELTDND